MQQRKGNEMETSLYATVGDTVQFVSGPQGRDEHRGIKGDWKTVEGPVVISGITVNGSEEFSKKYHAIKEFWPLSVIRFETPKKGRQHLSTAA
jgi:hypothetical protein